MALDSIMVQAYIWTLLKNNKVLFILKKSTLSLLPSFLLRLFLDGELSNSKPDVDMESSLELSF